MINIQPDDVITFTVVVVCSEPVSCFDPLNVDIFGISKISKNGQQRSFLFFMHFHMKNYKNFPFMSTLRQINEVM